MPRQQQAPIDLRSIIELYGLVSPESQIRNQLLQQQLAKGQQEMQYAPQEFDLRRQQALAAVNRTTTETQLMGPESEARIRKSNADANQSDAQTKEIPANADAQRKQALGGYFQNMNQGSAFLPPDMAKLIQSRVLNELGFAQDVQGQAAAKQAEKELWLSKFDKTKKPTEVSAKPKYDPAKLINSSLLGAVFGALNPTVAPPNPTVMGAPLRQTARRDSRGILLDGNGIPLDQGGDPSTVPPASWEEDTPEFIQWLFKAATPPVYK